MRPSHTTQTSAVVPLGIEHIKRIVELQLTHLRKLLGYRKITIDLSPEAKKLVTEDRFDPACGRGRSADDSADDSESAGDGGAERRSGKAIGLSQRRMGGRADVREGVDVR